MTREEDHPFAVRLGWIALLVTMAGLILGIYFGRHINIANHKINKNSAALKTTQDRLDTTQKKL